MSSALSLATDQKVVDMNNNVMDIVGGVSILQQSGTPEVPSSLIEYMLIVNQLSVKSQSLNVTSLSLAGFLLSIFPRHKTISSVHGRKGLANGC